MDSRKLSVNQRVKLLVDALDGAQSLNEELSNCKDGEAMIDLLLALSSKLELGLTRDELSKTAPIRDWIWWKNKESLVTLGSGTLRHQQDSSGKTRWDSWSLSLMRLFRKGENS